MRVPPPLLRSLFRARLLPFSAPQRTITTTPPLSANLPPLPTIPDTDITETFLKGSGPGGQKINKTNSAVQIQHHPTGIVVKCQETRSRSQNRKIARRLLAEKIEELDLGDGARSVMRIQRKTRKNASRDKKARRKYRKLAEGKEEDGEDAEAEAEVEEQKRQENQQPEGDVESTVKRESSVHEEVKV